MKTQAELREIHKPARREHKPGRRERRAAHRRRLRSKTVPCPMVGNAINQAKPLRSIGLGCHRNQVEQFNRDLRDAGISGACHEKDGTCVLESRQARNQVLKLRGMRDNDASYGDHAGDN